MFQPESFREEETVEQLRALKPDLCAVVAYGRILPQKVLDVPTFGCINIHASVLPAYRGSAPYQWAVLDGLKETGSHRHVSGPGDGCQEISLTFPRPPSGE